MKKLLGLILTAFVASAAACGDAGDEGMPDRLLRPLFVETDEQLRTFILDASRSAVFVWASAKERYITGRAKNENNPRRFIGIYLGNHRVLRRDDLLYTGFAVSPTGSALAALYSTGFEDRVGVLTVVPLTSFPVDHTANVEFSVPSGAVGPFATPEGRFTVLFPQDATTAEWHVFPEPVSTLAGPNISRAVWNKAGDRLYAADWVNSQVHVLAWPALTPITSVTLEQRPIDVALHPDDERFAVVTSSQLLLYSGLPTPAVEQSAPQTAFPYRLAFKESGGTALLAVLNQNTTLSFYDPETLCQVDVDAQGFAAENVRYFDTGAFSNPVLENVGTTVCPTFVPDQAWELTFEGVVADASGAVSSATAITFPTARVQAGDPIFVAGFASTVTAVAPGVVFFEPLPEALPFGEDVTVQVLAGNQWTVTGSAEGFLGRAQTDVPFSDRISFQITGAGAPPTRGDRFVFSGQGNVSPVFLSGAPSDLALDAVGNFLATVPEMGLVQAISAEQDEGQWAIQRLYTIP